MSVLFVALNIVAGIQSVQACEEKTPVDGVPGLFIKRCQPGTGFESKPRLAAVQIALLLLDLLIACW
jgi:hypothetical protein